jgi:NAD+ synthase
VTAPFTRARLALDAARETDRIVAWIAHVVRDVFRKRCATVGVSGGIDSSVVAALCARALGPENVLTLSMPERESAPETRELSALAARAAGTRLVVEDITGILEAAGCYARRDEALRRVVPDFADGWRFKIVLPPLLDSDRLRVFSAVVRDPSGATSTVRLDREAYLGVVAATSFKQRTRTMLLYHHADRMRGAVAGTPNRLEHELGFFVKGGDGAADLKPIGHLAKTHVFALAAHLGLPAEIRSRVATTDTYTLPQTQEEFYYSLPHDLLDLALEARDGGVGAAEAAPVLGLSVEQVERVYADIDAKRRVAEYLRMPPLIPEPRD